MKKMNSIRKRALFMVVVIVSGFLASSLMVLSTYATYFSENENNPESSLRAELYYEAIKKCLSSSKSKTATINLSNRSKTNTDEVNNYYRLSANQMFNNGAGSGNSNLLYSEMLEKMLREGMMMVSYIVPN